MSCRRTYLAVKHEVRNVLHDDMFCYVLVICYHTFFLKSFGLSLISGICVEAATNYAAVSIGNWYCFCFFQQLLFALRHAFQGFKVCNVLVYVGLFLMSAWLTFLFVKSIVFMHA